MCLDISIEKIAYSYALDALSWKLISHTKCLQFILLCKHLSNVGHFNYTIGISKEFLRYTGKAHAYKTQTFANIYIYKNINRECVRFAHSTAA